MKFNRFGLAVLGCAAILSASSFALAIQDEEMAMPGPAPEHALLMESVGTWDAAMKMWEGPGEPSTATGTEVNRALGELHVVSDFSGDMMGMAFVGHNTVSWDPTKQKYISVWIDNFEPTPAITEGTYDEATETLTFIGEGMMMGQRMKMRQVGTQADADHRSFEMYITPPGGEEMLSMRIDYTRRK